MPAPPAVSSLSSATAGDLQLVRSWLRDFARVRPSLAACLPAQHFSCSFSRSSGPGGQHVNKTLSRCTVRLPLPLPFAPPYVSDLLRLHSPYYVRLQDAIAASSDEHRSASANRDAAFERLHNAIIDTAARDVPGETSNEQRERVRGLQKADKLRTERDKRRRKDLKASRRAPPRG